MKPLVLVVVAYVVYRSVVEQETKRRLVDAANAVRRMVPL